MSSIVLLASIMAPCSIVLVSQLIEKVSLEYNNHSITHQKDKCAVGQIFLNYNKSSHIHNRLSSLKFSTCTQAREVIDLTMHLFFIHEINAVPVFSVS